MIRIVERFWQTRSLLAAMILLQVFWLVVRWLLMPAPNWRQLRFLIVYAVVIGVAIGFTPAGLVSRIRQLRKRLVQNEKLLVLILCLVVLAVGVVYANSRTRLLGDEPPRFDASKKVAVEGVTSFFADYGELPWLGRQHPPLIPLINGLAMRVLGVNIFVMRMISLVFATATILTTYFLSRELYDRDTALLTTFLLSSFPFFFHIGATGSIDMPVTCFFSLGLLLMLRLLRTPSYLLSVAAGLCIGAGLLSKYTMVLIYVVMLSYFVAHGPFRRLKLHLGILVLVSAGMLAAWLVYAHHIGVFSRHRGTVVYYAGMVMTGDYGRRLIMETFVASLPSALGVHNLPVLFLGGLSLVQRRNQPDLLVLLWIASVSLPLMLTLPDPRYFMPAFPALAVVMARGLKRIPEATERVVMLALFYGGEALYLYIVISQTARLILR
jgi:4-amino-4-deoxy-L-arabinose transferase-like glycosyltransferase